MALLCRFSHLLRQNSTSRIARYVYVTNSLVNKYVNNGSVIRCKHSDILGEGKEKIEIAKKQVESKESPCCVPQQPCLEAQPPCCEPQPPCCEPQPPCCIPAPEPLSCIPSEPEVIKVPYRPKSDPIKKTPELPKLQPLKQEEPCRRRRPCSTTGITEKEQTDTTSKKQEHQSKEDKNALSEKKKISEEPRKSKEEDEVISIRQYKTEPFTEKSICKNTFRDEKATPKCENKVDLCKTIPKLNKIEEKEIARKVAKKEDLKEYHEKSHKMKKNSSNIEISEKVGNSVNKLNTELGGKKIVKKDGSTKQIHTKVADGGATSCKANNADSKPTPAYEELDSSFNNSITAYKSKTTFELLRAYIVYQLCSIPFLVSNNMAIMKFANKILGDKIFIWSMKQTVYGHFVAGEDLVIIKPVVQKLQSFGVKSILDYSVEEDISSEKAENLEKAALKDAHTQLPQYKMPSKHLDRRDKLVSARTFFYEGEEACEKNMEMNLKVIEAVPQTTSNTGMTAIKLTALGRPQILLELSEVITKTRKYLANIDGQKDGEDCPVLSHHITKDLIKERIGSKAKQTESYKKFIEFITDDQKGVIDIFPWSGIINDKNELNETFKVPDLQTGEMVPLLSKLTEQEMDMFRNMVRRLNTIIQAAADLNVPVMIDAEQTYFQPAISRLTVEMMRKYNIGKGIVYNTYQNYLKSSHCVVAADLEQALRQNFYFRCKLVRGAYLEQERQRAKEMNYTDPTLPNYEATTNQYHNVLTECLRRIKELKDKGDHEKKIGIVVASHNENTVRFAVEKMKEIGIDPTDETIAFGQLLGMCDFITFTLGQSGYSVYKYVPFGPVKEVLPYLSRRANENKGLLKNVKKEKTMLAREIWRRTKSLDKNKKPSGPFTPV